MYFSGYLALDLVQCFLFDLEREIKGLYFFFFLTLAPSQSLVPKETPTTALQGSVARPGKAHFGNSLGVEWVTCGGTIAALSVPGGG